MWKSLKQDRFLTMSIKAKIDNLTRGDLDQRTCTCVVFCTQEQCIASANATNRGWDVHGVMRLIKAQIQFDAAKLRDENFDLHSFMPGAKLVRPHQHRIALHYCIER